MNEIIHHSTLSPNNQVNTTNFQSQMCVEKKRCLHYVFYKHNKETFVMNLTAKH